MDTVQRASRSSSLRVGVGSGDNDTISICSSLAGLALSEDGGGNVLRAGANMSTRSLESVIAQWHDMSNSNSSRVALIDDVDEAGADNIGAGASTTNLSQRSNDALSLDWIFFPSTAGPSSSSSSLSSRHPLQPTLLDTQLDVAVAAEPSMHSSTLAATNTPLEPFGAQRFSQHLGSRDDLSYFPSASKSRSDALLIYGANDNGLTKCRSDSLDSATLFYLSDSARTLPAMASDFNQNCFMPPEKTFLDRYISAGSILRPNSPTTSNATNQRSANSQGVVEHPLTTFTNTNNVTISTSAAVLPLTSNNISADSTRPYPTHVYPSQRPYQQRQQRPPTYPRINPYQQLGQTTTNGPNSLLSSPEDIYPPMSFNPPIPPSFALIPMSLFPPLPVPLPSPRVAAQWLASRLEPYVAYCGTNQLPSSLAILGGNFPDIHIGYAMPHKLSPNSNSFVLLEQMNLVKDTMELHIPTNTNVLNYLLSWTTVYAANSFGIYRLTLLQAHILPLFVRPLVNYSEKIINKERMPHVIVGIGENSCGKTWAYLLGCIDYIVRGCHFQRGELQIGRAATGPKAIIVLPSKEAVLKMKKLLAELSNALNQSWIKSQEIAGYHMWDEQQQHAAKPPHRLLTYLAIQGNILNNPLSLGMNEFDIIVSTPAFLRMVCDAGRLRLDNVKHFIVDEVTRVSDSLSLKNFTDDVRAVVCRLPRSSKEHSLKAAIFSRVFTPNTAYLVQQIAAAFPAEMSLVSLDHMLGYGCDAYVKISMHHRMYPPNLIPKAPLSALNERLLQYAAGIQKEFIAVGESSHFEQLGLLIQQFGATHGVIVLTDEPTDAIDLAHRLQQIDKQVFLVLPDILEQVASTIQQTVIANARRQHIEPLILITFRARADTYMPSPYPSNGTYAHTSSGNAAAAAAVARYYPPWMVDLRALASELSWHIVNFTCPATIDDYYISLLTCLSPRTQLAADQTLKMTFNTYRTPYQCSPRTVYTLYGLEDHVKANVYQSLF